MEMDDLQTVSHVEFCASLAVLYPLRLERLWTPAGRLCRDPAERIFAQEAKPERVTIADRSAPDQAVSDVLVDITYNWRLLYA